VRPLRHPDGAFRRFGDVDAALAHVRAHGAPVVVKADGLAAGKGVTVATTLAEAEAAVRDIFSGRFGAPGAEIIIEDCLEGEEVSFFALCDGKTAVPLATAQDHKRAFDGDTGPNTGGMGAYSPALAMSEEMSARSCATSSTRRLPPWPISGRRSRACCLPGSCSPKPGPS
jgi:phosphoribosylamine---glycine ligase